MRRGGPEVLRSHPGAALLLCFPPPGDDMAAKCLRGFSGDTVCHIGEWGGQTADEKFEELLLDGFDVLKASDAACGTISCLCLPDNLCHCFISVWPPHRSFSEVQPSLL